MLLAVYTESIAVLAAGKITAGANALSVLRGEGGSLKDVAVVLWVLAILWLPLLLLAEVLRPRLDYDVSRWSTVFQVGMYSAGSFVVGAVAGAGAITTSARAWV